MSTGEIALRLAEAADRYRRGVNHWEPYMQEVNCILSGLRAELTAALARAEQAERERNAAREEAPETLESYLVRQWDWSKRTFGPGKRTGGVTQHIAKELEEVRAKPDDLSEWVDIIILAMDGYWRHGGTPEGLIPDLLAKQKKNFSRRWPTPTSEDVAVEHDRTAPEAPGG